MVRRDDVRRYLTSSIHISLCFSFITSSSSTSCSSCCFFLLPYITSGAPLIFSIALKLSKFTQNSKKKHVRAPLGFQHISFFQVLYLFSYHGGEQQDRVDECSGV